MGSFYRGTDHYGGPGASMYRDNLSVSLAGARLSETFGEYSYSERENAGERMSELSSEDNYASNIHDDDDRRTPSSEGSVPRGVPNIHAARSSESGSQAFGYEDMDPDSARQGSAGYDEYGSHPYFSGEDVTHAESHQETAVRKKRDMEELYSPPMGYWHPSSDYSTIEYAIKRMIENRDNLFDMYPNMEYVLANGSKTSWTMASEWGKDGKLVPYLYSGSPFNPSRTISRIWLMDASHNGDISQTLHFSMHNALTGLEMFKPIIPSLVRTHEEGPTHIFLRPGDHLRSPVMIWHRDLTTRRSPVVEEHPGMTERDLRKEMSSDSLEVNLVKNLVPGKSVLLDYIQDKVENEGFAEVLEDKTQESGYYRIYNSEVDTFIQNWQIDQSRDLSVEHLWNIRVTPNRGVRSSKGSPTFHEDKFKDRAEIKSKMSDWTMGDTTAEDEFVQKVIHEKPITLYWQFRVELVPQRRRAG